MQPLSKHLRNLLRFPLCNNNFFIGKKKRNGNHVRCFSLNLINIFTKSKKGRQMHIYHVTGLLFVCYCARSKFITKIQILTYKYFRYAVFRSPRYYYRCTIGARYERAPNFSCHAFRYTDFQISIRLFKIEKNSLISNSMPYQLKQPTTIKILKNGFLSNIITINRSKSMTQ